MWLYFKTFFLALAEIDFKFLNKVYSLMRENIFYHKSIVRFTFFIIFLVFLIQNTFFFTYFFLNESFNFIQEKTDIILELRTWISKYEIDPLIDRFNDIEWVSSVNFVSWVKSLNDLTLNHPSLVWIIEKYDIDNPLPDIIEIRLQNMEASTIARSIIREWKYSNVLNLDNMAIYDKQQEKVIKFSEYLMIVFYIWIVCFLSFLILYFLILKNTFSRVVNYHVYQIKILKNFWASFLFIRFPYFFSFIWFISSFIISLFLFYLFIIIIWIDIANLNAGIIVGFIQYTVTYFLSILLFIWVSSCFISFLTTRLYLKSI